jgi:hypothetical protein
MSAIISYDGDGGGFSAHLLHHIVDHKLSRILGIQHYTAYSPLKTLVHYESKNLIRLNEKSLIELTGGNNEHIYLEQLYNSMSCMADVVNYLQSKTNLLILSGRHHIPDIARENIYELFGSKNDFLELVKSCFGQLTLNAMSTDRHYKWYSASNSLLSTNSIGIHLRTFFDSSHGRKTFKIHYGELTGWIITEIETLLERNTPNCIFVASDSVKHAATFKKVIKKVIGKSLKTKVFVSPWEKTHSSLSRVGLKFEQDISLIKKQVSIENNDLSYMLTSLYDWFLLSSCRDIISTSSSFPASTRLFGINENILCYPCSDEKLTYPKQRATLY